MNRQPSVQANVVGTCGQPWVAGVLDVAERLAALGLYGSLIFRVLSEYRSHGGAANIIVLLSEGLVVLFMLIRRSATDVSWRPTDWLLAIVATVTPLLVQPVINRTVLPPALGVGLMLVGLLVQLLAKLTLGRSFGWVPAHRGLTLSGPYRLVRHPMYAGYLLCHAAFLLMNLTYWNAAAYALCYAAQVPRLLAEERLLRRDQHYADYMAAVRFRLLPGIF